MYKLLLILCFGLLNLQAITWHSLEDAQKLQKQSSKIIMLNISASHCQYCKKMDKNVFKNAQTSKWLEKRFIAVKIDMDNEEVPFMLDVRVTPTFYFIDSKENIVKVIPGSWNIEDFKDLSGKIK